MSFQPLDPDTVIDPFMVASLTGPDANTGIYLDADPMNSSVLIKTNDTPALYIDKFQNLGVNTLSPSAQLDVNSSSGSCIQLTYNGSTTNKANISVTSDGKLALSAGGSEVNIDTSTSFNIKSHNSLNSGLLLNNTLVRASADQLNYNIVTPGTAAPSKALVLNSSSNITGIATLSATNLTGTLQTSAQPNIESVSVLDITDHSGVAGLSLGGVLVSATAEELNYVDTSAGQAQASKALVLDSSRNITNINELSASKLTGTIQSADQPNITSVGTLTGLDLDGSMTGLVDLSINTTESGRTLVVNSESGNCFRLFYDAASGAFNYTDMLVDSSGNLIVTSSGGNVDITSHNGSSVGLKLGSVLVTATADQINYLQGTTPGSVLAGKAVIADTNRNLANINALTATSLTGTLQTASQPNITSVSTLNISAHDGSTAGLKLNGGLVTSTAEELNYLDTTQGQAEASKALVVDSSKDISGIHSLSADELTGTLQTAAQPNVTSVGTLSSISTSGNFTMGTTTISESEIGVLDAVVPGTVAPSKAIVVDDNKDISAFRNLTATTLTGTLQTAAQPNITSVSTLNVTDHNGLSIGLQLGGSLVTASGTELNYVDTTPGTVEASKAIVVDANRNIANINSLSASQLTGTIQTASQPNITSVGRLSSISTSGDLTMGTTTISESEIGVLDSVTAGTVTASKAVVVDSNKDISSFRNLTAVNLTGTLQTAAQPNIASVATLDITNHDGTTQGLKLGGTLLTATASQINAIFGAGGGTGTFNNLAVNDTLTLANANGTSKGIVLGSTLVTSSGDELNYLDGSVPGTVVPSKAVVVDGNKDISSFRNLTATNLTGTIQTAAQPNITSVGTLSSISTSGTLTLGATTISQSEIGVLDAVVPGIVSASKALVADSSKAISGLSNVSTGCLTLLNTASQYGETWVGGTAAKWTVDSLIGLSVYSPTLDRALVFAQSNAFSTQYMIMNSPDGFSGGMATFTSTTIGGVGGFYVRAAIWHPTQNVFIIATSNDLATNPLVIYSSPTGLANTWTSIVTLTVASRFSSNFSYHAPSGHIVFFSRDAFWFSANGTTWNSVTGFNNVIGQYYSRLTDYLIFNNSTVIIGNYAMYSVSIDSPGNYFAFWNGTTWTRYLTSANVDALMELKDYNPVEDRLYIRVNFGAPLTFRVVESASTKTPDQWLSTMSTTISLSNTLAIPVINFVYVQNYGIIAVGRGQTGLTNASRSMGIIIINNKTLTREVLLQGTSTISWNVQEHSYPLYWSSTGVITYPSPNSASTYGSVISVPSAVSNGIVFGSTTITENEIAVLDSNTAGVASASKALVLNSSKNISGINSLTATNLTATGVTTTSVTVGATNIVESEIAVLDNATAGSAVASKALVVDSNRNIVNINTLSSSSLTSTAGTLTMGATAISESEIAVLDNATAGSAVASKALVVDSSRNIVNINSLSSSSLTSTAGALTMGATTISESEIAVLDAVVPGTVAASKAVVVDANKDASSFRNLTATNFIGTLQTAAQPNITSVGSLVSLNVAGNMNVGGALTVGGTIISENEIGALDEVVPGTVSASKAIVVDANKDIASFRNLTATNLTGTLQTASQPNITSVSTFDVTAHNGTTQGLKLGGVLLTATANQINSIFGAGGEGTFTNLTVNDTLTLANADGSSMGLVLGSTLVTATGTELNYVDTTPGHAQASKALVFDENINIDNINSLSATSLTGTLQTTYQPNLTSVDVIDITDHDGATQGLKLGGVLLTATATQINSIFSGSGGSGTFNSLTVNDTLTLANADGSEMGLVLGSTLLTATGVELNYLDGSLPGTATAGNALVLDSSSNISGINSLSASQLTGTLQTAAQPNVTSVGTLTSISTSGNLTMGTTTISESEIGVLDAVIPGTVFASKAVVVDANKDISSFRNLTAENLTGTLQTVAQPNITSVGELTSLAVAGDVNVGGSLTVGGTLISENEIVALDSAVPGTATANKAMVTDSSNSIAGINSLSATNLTGTLQTAAQPNITSVGELTSLDVAGDVNVGGSLVVGGTFISEAEILALDEATPGTAERLKAMITDGNNSISGINSLSATDLTGTLQTASQPNLTSVSVLDITSHDGSTAGLKLGGTLVTASASEINYVDTTAGSAQASKALVLNSSKDIAGINNMGMVRLTAAIGSFESTIDSTSTGSGAISTAGGVGIAKALNVGTNASIGGSISVVGTSTLMGDVQVSTDTDSTSVSTGSLTTAGGVGIAKSLYVGADAIVSGDVLISGTTSQAGVVTVTNDTDSTSTTNGCIVANGGVGVAKSIVVGENATIGGDISVTGDIVQYGVSIVSNTTESTSTSTGSITTDGGVGIAKSLNVGGDAKIVSPTNSTTPTSGALTVVGGVGIAKNLNVGENASITGDVSIAGATGQAGILTVSNTTDSSSTSTGAVVTTGGVGIAKSLNVGLNASVGGNVSITGTTTQAGVVSITNPTQSTSPSTGSFVTAGGVGIGQDVNVGGNANISGNLVVDGSISQSGATDMTNDTDSISTTTGALVIAGGVGVAKSVNIGGATKISSVEVSNSTTTGALQVLGGTGVNGNLNVGGNVGVAGNINLSGNIDIDGQVVSSNISFSSTTGVPFSTSMLTTITNTNTVLSLNYDAGIGYVKSTNTLMVVPLIVTKESVLYKSPDGGSTWATVGLAGAALTAYEEYSSDFSISVSQLVVNPDSGKVWISGAFYSTSLESSLPVVLSGTTAGLSTIHFVGSMITTGSDATCTNLAVASDSKAAVLLYKGSAVGETPIYYLSNNSFALNVNGNFAHLAWVPVLEKFMATRSNVSSIYYSTDSNCTTWMDATTPSSVAPNTIHYNTTLQIAIAVGPNFIWHSVEGAVWTNGTYSPLATGDTFTAVVNSPIIGIFAVYSNVENSMNQVYYSTDGETWSTATIPQTFGSDVPLTSNVAYDSSNYAYSSAYFNSSNTIQRLGPFDFSTTVYSIGVASDYVQSKSGTGYQWFNSSTPSTIGSELMQLNSIRLEVNTIGHITDTTETTSASTGALIVDGGVGIAKSAKIGDDLSVGGDLAIAGSTNHTGIVTMTNTAESSSSSTGALVVTGGVGIANNLNVGANAEVGGSLSIVGTTSHIGSVTVFSTTDSTTIFNGAFVTDGGVGIAKNLNVGGDTSIAGDVSILGSNTQTGVLTVSDATESSSTLTGAIITSGGVGIAKSISVGLDASIGGDVSIGGTTTQTGDVSIASLTDSSSSNTGSLKTAGGVGIAKSLFVGANASVAGNVSITGTTTQTGVVSISNTTDSSSPLTGALVVSGGVGIDKNLSVRFDTSIGGTLAVAGINSITNPTDSTSVTDGSLVTAGGVGIAKTLRVGGGIYGTLMTPSQPNILSVSVLDITNHNGVSGLELGGVLITSSATELNYLDGCTPGTATAGNALVLNSAKSISDINSLSATTLTGTLQTADQPNIETVTILDVTSHDGSSVGLKLGGVLLTATANQLNNIVNGSFSPSFVNGTVANNFTISGHDGSTTGLILGSTLVTATGTELNYVDTTPGSAEASRALVLDASSNISGINSLSATDLTGTLQTAAQPNITSVTTLDITGHNGSTLGLKLGGVLVTSTAAELNYLDTTAGTAEASKALVLDSTSNIAGINSLSASQLIGTLQTATQANITSVGTLTSLAVAGDVTIGSTIISETDIAKIDAITDGVAAANKALVLNANKSIGGINALDASTVAIGGPAHADLPLEVGTVPYLFAGAYAYSNQLNAHGLVDAGEAVISNYSLRTDGRILCTGEIQLTSDKRMKKNIIELTTDFSKKFVMTTTPVKFNWITGDDQTEYGYIAQDVLRAGFEDLVSVTAYPGMEGSVDEDGFINPKDAKFTFSPGKIVPMLALNQRDVFVQLEEKDAKIASLEERIAKLEEMIAKLV